MKKITLVFLLLTGFIWGQTVSVDVTELTNVQNVQLVANFGGAFNVYQATDDGGGVWSFDMSGSGDVQNEYVWLVTFTDTNTLQEDLIPTVVGQAIENDLAVDFDFNTNFFSFCNRRVTIGGADVPTTYFNSWRQPGVVYTELTLTASAPGPGENYYILYDVNGFSEFGGPGAVDNGDGTYTAIVRPTASFEYKWILNDDAGTAAADTNEDLLSCTNDGVTINTDNSSFANRIHAAGEDKMDEFGVCPDTGGGTPPQSAFCDTEVTHFGGNADSVINLTIENTGADSITLTATNPGGLGGEPNFLGIAGTPPSGATIGSPVPITGGVSLTLTWAGAPPTDVVFEFIQWRKTGTGPATWQLGDTVPNATVPFDAICGNPAQDVSLSDLQIDGVTIDGFGPSTTTYDIGLASATPVPQITSVVTNNPNAVVGTITQASGVPGAATFDVTSEDSSVTETYTVNFTIQVPGTELIENGSFETGDFTGWTQAESSPGQQTVVGTNPSEGSFAANINNTNAPSASTIKSANRGIGIVNPGDEVTIKFDLRGSGPAGGVFFAELFSELSGGGTSASELLGGGPVFPNADPDVWTTFEFTTNVGPDVSGGISLQFNAATGGAPGSQANFFIDNVSMVNNDEVLSVNDATANLELRIFPNPSKDNWNITSSNNQNLTSVRIYDLLGKEVMVLNPNSTEVTINASSLKSGIYLAKLSTVNGSKTIKLVKN
ncbi:T9SS type A sorting domain-containing protein [Winogradskyella alexanderae]|uniref:T9SS type A sorting domain-containing protein n=1 Tax=Winogradskyella alexanderae TaxID=2877123 RepID=A0ABS7XTK9_9FLAO|nr:T9SS type A sorting domain-containing protein [Winogradskyella alexanderae]MCA0133366.1 T9SS type A sorting domain-containing protein [Winogradskyella alexanderae]